MRIAWWFILTLFMVSGWATEEKRQIVISHVIHPQVSPFIDIVKQAYQNAGFAVEFVPTPTKRGLDMVNAGEIDADVVRSKKIIDQHPNLIAIQPRLATIGLYLICQAELPCNQQVLMQPTQIILTSHNSFEHIASIPHAAQFEFNELENTLFALASAGRAPYVMMAINSRQSSFDQDGLHYFKITEAPLHHVIHYSLSPYIHQIEQAITDLLQQTSQKNLEKN